MRAGLRLGAAAGDRAASELRRAEQHRRIVPEDVLRAVAVVHVPIDDRHALGPMPALGVAGGDGGVVEETKPIALDFSAWWPGGREATKTLSALPVKTSSTAAIAPPIPVSAACGLWAGIGVGLELVDLAVFLRHLPHHGEEMLFRMRQKRGVLGDLRRL